MGIYVGSTDASADADLKEIDKAVFFSIFSLRFAFGKRPLREWSLFSAIQ
jgi:hypothetical protein